MINEVSQNLLGSIATQTKGGVGHATPAAAKTRVEAASNVEPAPARSPVEEKEPTTPLGERQLDEVVDNLNEYAQAVRRKLQFSVEEGSGRTVIKVIDAETDEVIREIPPEEIRNMSKHLGEANGLLFHNKA